MYFDEYIGHETKEREYKIGVINLEENMSNDYILFLLKTGKWIFNTYIYDTIRCYIRKYIPRYISSFINSRITNGEFYIGVNDDGIVKGIPFKGKINHDFINNCLKKSIDELLKFHSKRDKEFLKRNITFELINVNFKKEGIQTEWYNVFLKRFFYRAEKQNNYKKQKDMWKRVLLTQTQKKLYYILNEQKNKFIEYVRDNRIFTKTKYRHSYSHLDYLDLAGVPDYYSMMGELNTKEFQNTPGEVLAEYRKFNIGLPTKLHYKEINNCILLYIFGDYKDLCVRSLKIAKPHEKIISSGLYPKCLLGQVDKMIPVWVNSNRSINIYVIKFNIPCNFIPDGNIMFLNEKKRKYETCFRESEEIMGPVTKYIKNDQ